VEMSSLTDTDADFDSLAGMLAQLARCTRGQGGGLPDAELGTRPVARRLSTLRADPRLVPLDPLTAHLGGASTLRGPKSPLPCSCSRIR
jgi:hypothetical protein